MGFVPKEDITECMKAILAAQRDHGNRDVRANARMKYLVHTLGIDNFRTLVESYFGKPIAPWRDMAEWKYNDWMGWWDQGDTSDDLEELTVQLINTYIYGEDGENGDIALEVLDTQDEEGIHRNVVFFHDKVTIRHVTFVDEHEYEWEDDDEDEEDFDDMDDLTDYDDPEWPHDHPKDKTDHDPEPTDADHETQ